MIKRGDYMKINKCLLATSSLIFSLICLNSVYANNFIIPEDAIEFNGHAYN